MASYRLCASAMLAALVLSAGGAAGQGIPVIDQTAVLKQIESIAQLKSQLDALHQQIEQAQRLYGSLNKLTDMADAAGLLNDPSIRKALPSSFAAIEGLLRGESNDGLGEAATTFLEANTTYRTDADDFYATELSRFQNKNAGQASLGERIYDVATKRIDGIDQLRERISTAYDAKAVADLQARLQAEQAFLQIDVLRMEALRMVQQAQAQVDEQRKVEDWRHRMDAMKAALQ